MSLTKALGAPLIFPLDFQKISVVNSAAALSIVGGTSRVETCPLAGLTLLAQCLGAADAACLIKDTGPCRALASDRVRCGVTAHGPFFSPPSLSAPQSRRAGGPGLLQQPCPSGGAGGPGAF